MLGEITFHRLPCNRLAHREFQFLPHIIESRQTPRRSPWQRTS